MTTTTTAVLDIKHWAPRIVPRQADPLIDRAQRNYPDSAYLQQEWLRAVAVVRKTSGGWRLDNPITREATK